MHLLETNTKTHKIIHTLLTFFVRTYSTHNTSPAKSSLVDRDMHIPLSQPKGRCWGHTIIPSWYQELWYVQVECQMNKGNGMNEFHVQRIENPRIHQSKLCQLEVDKVQLSHEFLIWLLNMRCMYLYHFSVHPSIDSNGFKQRRPRISSDYNIRNYLLSKNITRVMWPSRCIRKALKALLCQCYRIMGLNGQKETCHYQHNIDTCKYSQNDL